MKITKITATGSGIEFRNVLPTGTPTFGYTNTNKRILRNQTIPSSLQDTSIKKTVNCASIDWNNAYLPNTFNLLGSDEKIQEMIGSGKGIKDTTQLLYIFDKLAELI